MRQRAHLIRIRSPRLRRSIKGSYMDQAAIDALVYWVGAFFLGGFAIGVIVKLLLGNVE